MDVSEVGAPERKTGSLLRKACLYLRAEHPGLEAPLAGPTSDTACRYAGRL